MAIQRCVSQSSWHLKTGMKLNTLALGLFSVLIMLLGAMGFLMPENISVLSTTYAYNLFRVDLGLIGIIMALSGDKKIISYGNLGMGIILFYQASASFLGLYPIQHFQWTIVDDILNADIGLAMMLISLFEKD
jgi:hypothetical protein